MEFFNESLVVVHKIKETLTLNRPAYLGMCTLTIVRHWCTTSTYNYIEIKYGDRAKLLFTDTGRLTYEIEAEDVY